MQPDRETRRATLDPWIIPPVVIAVLAYGIVLRIASVYFLCTLRYPSPGERSIFLESSSGLGHVLTALNVGFALLLVHGLVRARLRPASVRLGQIAGMLLALICLAIFQWLIQTAPDLYWSGFPGGR